MVDESKTDQEQGVIFLQDWLKINIPLTLKLVEQLSLMEHDDNNIDEFKLVNVSYSSKSYREHSTSTQTRGFFKRPVWLMSQFGDGWFTPNEEGKEIPNSKTQSSV